MRHQHGPGFVHGQCGRVAEPILVGRTDGLRKARDGLSRRDGRLFQSSGPDEDARYLGQLCERSAGQHQEADLSNGQVVSGHGRAGSAGKSSLYRNAGIRDVQIARPMMTINIQKSELKSMRTRSRFWSLETPSRSERMSPGAINSQSMNRPSLAMPIPCLSSQTAKHQPGRKSSASYPKRAGPCLAIRSAICSRVEFA